MSRPTPSRKKTDNGFPRPRGDEPDDARLEGAMIAFSPPTRG